MKLMATIGALEVKPEELKVTLETRFLDALEEVRREQREAKRNNT